MIYTKGAKKLVILLIKKHKTKDNVTEQLLKSDKNDSNPLRKGEFYIKIGGINERKI